jgi:N6-L-threonylcarbamoyladenine synthase
MLVFVINKNNQPLMPCSARKAKTLLKQHCAKIVKRTPFTIKLLHGSSGYKQTVTLGVDAGSKEVGFSATTATKVLFENKLILRTDLVKLLATRREFRRNRRARKTRYRQPRFLNRNKPAGWLAPSIENKINAHLKSTDLIHNILPISQTIVEVASFDIQKINNPGIQGKEYQQGNQLDFWNVREYVFFRDKHKCKGKTGCTNKILNVHHIETRKTGGNSPGNLITLCEDCHNDYHKGKLKLSLKRSTAFRDAAFMGITRWAFYNKLKLQYPNVSLTFGYLTKNTRITNNLPKEHNIDARCISGNPLAIPSLNIYLSKRVRTQNRQLHKATINKGGTRKKNKSPKYVKGFQLFDKVRYQNQECFIFGRRVTGKFDIRELAGKKLSAGTSSKRLTLLEKATSTLIQIQK